MIKCTATQRTSKICWTKEARLKRGHTVWSHLDDVLEPANLRNQNSGCLRREGHFCGEWKCSRFRCTGGHTGIYTCKSSLNSALKICAFYYMQIAHLKKNWGKETIKAVRENVGSHCRSSSAALGGNLGILNQVTHPHGLWAGDSTSGNQSYRLIAHTGNGTCTRLFTCQAVCN